MSAPVRVKLKRRFNPNETILMTPLIDILLVTIFFILNTTISLKPAIEVNLPEAASGSVVTTQEIFITIRADEVILIDRQPVNLDTFSAVLKQKTDNLGASVRPTMVINSDRSIPYQTLISVMDRIRLLGFTDIALGTTPQR